MRPSSFAFSSLAAFLSYAHPRASRLSSRHAVLPCVSSRASRCVVSSILPSGLFVPSARLGLSSRFAPFRSAVRSFSFRLSWRSCLAFPCRLVLPLASRLSYAPPRHCVPSDRLVLICYLVRSHPWAAHARSHACSPCSHRSVLLVARSCPLIGPSSSCSHLRRRAWRGVMAMGRGRVALIVLSVPSCSYSLLTHSLRDGGGRMKSWGTVSCCSPLVPSLLMSHRSPHHV